MARKLKKLQPLEKFNRPTCKVCGAEAAIVQVPDSACGEPGCCPQTNHIELQCNESRNHNFSVYESCYDK